MYTHRSWIEVRFFPPSLAELKEKRITEKEGACIRVMPSTPGAYTEHYRKANKATSNASPYSPRDGKPSTIRLDLSWKVAETKTCPVVLERKTSSTQAGRINSSVASSC